MLFKLLGWKFAEDGDKAEKFSEDFGALGIRIIRDETESGIAKFTNIEKRSRELLETIDSFMQKGTMTLVEAQN